MSEWYDSQMKLSSNFRQLLQERTDKANPRRKLTSEEAKRLKKLEAIADKLWRGENVQNRQLQTWLSEAEYEQLEYEWQEQIELRNERKDKPSDLNDTRRSCEKLPLTTIAQKAIATKASILLLRNFPIRVKAFVKMR
tara:strand:+ start:1029 stop:1442 length:414 start_codon:yes stop_codon:yes gene_type:complete